MKFTDILAPIDSQDFIKDYWEKQYLHVPRKNRGYYDSIVSIEDIDNYLFGNDNLAVSPFKFYSGKLEANIQNWSTKQVLNDVASNVLDHQKVGRLFNQGYSLYLNYPDSLFPKLKYFVGRLEETLKAKIVTHLIISPPHSQGFLPHTDPYGVFSLQLAGNKLWNIYGMADGPMLSHGQDLHHYTEQQPLQTIDVTAGSLLYLPRGLVHSVRTGNEYSFHLSLGIVPPKGKDIIRLLEEATQTHSFFNEYVPFGFLGSDIEMEKYQRTLKEQLIDLIQQADIHTLLDSSFVKHRTSMSQNRMAHMMSIHALQTDTLLRIKPGLSYIIQEDKGQGKCMLAFEGKYLTFPIFWKEELKQIEKTPTFSVKELGSSLQISEQDQIQVAKNMIQAGFLEIFPNNLDQEI